MGLMVWSEGAAFSMNTMKEYFLDDETISDSVRMCFRIYWKTILKKMKIMIFLFFCSDVNIWWWGWDGWTGAVRRFLRSGAKNIHFRLEKRGKTCSWTSWNSVNKIWNFWFLDFLMKFWKFSGVSQSGAGIGKLWYRSVSPLRTTVLGAETELGGPPQHATPSNIP